MSACFDKTSRAAVNKMAALLFSKGQKVGRPPCTPQNAFHTENPVYVRRIRKDDTGSPQFRDLTGVQFGRMTVLGRVVGLTGKDGTARWFCRCNCGAKEVRTSKAIKNPENRGDRCVACRLVAHARVTHEMRTSGVILDQRDL